MMLGICIELKTTCKHCSSPLMLNAFTENVLCSSCNKYNYFDGEEWKNLLEDDELEQRRRKDKIEKDEEFED